MNLDHAHYLSKFMDLGEIVSEPETVHGGRLNLMWSLVTRKGKFAIKELNIGAKLYEQKRSCYEATEEVARGFADKGIPVVTALVKDGNSLVKIDDKLYIIYPWLEGKILKNNEISPSQAEKIATILAKIHLLDLQISAIENPQYNGLDIDHITALTDLSFAKNLSFAASLKAMLPIFAQINEKYHQHIPIFSKNLVISHSDLDPKNVMWTDDQTPILIDWESAKLINPVQELVSALFDWSGIIATNISLENLERMIVAYKKTGSIIDKKIILPSFYIITKNWIDWLVFNVERSTMTDQLPASEKVLRLEESIHVLKALDYLTKNLNNLATIVTHLA